MKEIIYYKHHGRTVAVKSELRGKNREHCLCYGCALFRPGSPRNCRIAQDTFENCVKHGIVSPVYECPKFIDEDSFAKLRDAVVPSRTLILGWYIL